MNRVLFAAVLAAGVGFALGACDETAFHDQRLAWCEENKSRTELLNAGCEGDWECCDQLGWFCDKDQPSGDKPGTCVKPVSGNPDGGGGPPLNEQFCDSFASACHASGNCYFTQLTGTQATPPTNDGRRGFAWVQLRPADGAFDFCFTHNVTDVTATTIAQGVSRHPGTSSTALAANLVTAHTSFVNGYDLTAIEARITFIEVASATSATPPIRGQLIRAGEALFVASFMQGGTGGTAQVTVDQMNKTELGFQAELSVPEFSRVFVAGGGYEVEVFDLAGSNVYSVPDPALVNAIFAGSAKVEIRDMDGVSVSSSQQLFKQFP